MSLLPYASILGLSPPMSQDHRRERERRVDAGDETAKLKFTRHTCRMRPCRIRAHRAALLSLRPSAKHCQANAAPHAAGSRRLNRTADPTPPPRSEERARACGEEEEEEEKKQRTWAGQGQGLGQRQRLCPCS